MVLCIIVDRIGKRDIFTTRHQVSGWLYFS